MYFTYHYKADFWETIEPKIFKEPWIQCSLFYLFVFQWNLIFCRVFWWYDLTIYLNTMNIIQDEERILKQMILLSRYYAYIDFKI